ncbi:MAG: DUF2846 domain-containing protein [Flavipsychrobacter sp.]
MKSFIIILSLLFTTAIAPNVQGQTAEEVHIVGELVSCPTAELKKVGVVNIDGLDAMRDSKKLLAKATQRAKEQGGNILKVRKLKTPDGGSAAYRIAADVYYTADLNAFIAQKKQAASTAVEALLPDTASYALLYVYRPHAYTSAAARYKIYLNDTLACKVASGSKHILKLYQQGATKLNIKGRGNTDVNINITHGKVYFLRCDVSLQFKENNAFKTTQVFTLVDPYPGWEEYNGFKGRDE